MIYRLKRIAPNKLSMRKHIQFQVSQKPGEGGAAEHLNQYRISPNPPPKSAIPKPHRIRIQSVAPRPAPRNEKSHLDWKVNAVSDKKMAVVIATANNTELVPLFSLAVPTAQYTLF